MRIVSTIYLLILSITAFSQVRYAGKVETGYLSFLSRTITVEPGPNWKGYYLNNSQNGIAINFSNGISLANRRLFSGLGIGYLNFEGIQGFSAYGEVEYIPLKKAFSPLFNLKIGYDHIWNQYPGGTGTLNAEINAGINYNLYKKVGVYLKTGIRLTQQSIFIPAIFGIRF
jgi:hypothetical protein